MGAWAQFAQVAMGVTKGSLKREELLEESEALQMQADILGEESQEAAADTRLEASERASTQGVNFLKSGVKLEGTPLLVTGETKRRGERHAQSIERRGEAQYSLYRTKSKRAYKKGRMAFLEGAMEGVTNAYGGQMGMGGSK